jgi:proline iminopeptidase
MPTVNGLHTASFGAGPPVLVMHGGMGLDHTYFRPWLDPVGSDATLAYYDHRGNGRSAEPSDWGAFGLDEWTSDAEAVRASVGAERVVVLGHSCAVFLALEYARRYPQRVAGLILCSGAPVLDYGDRIFALAAKRGTPEELARLTTLFTAPTLNDDAYKEHYLSILPLYFHRFPPEYGEQVARNVRFSAEAFLHGRDNLFATFDSRPWLHAIKAPALVIGGRDDFITPLSEGAVRLASALPDSDLEVFEHSGHFPFIEETERFNGVVQRWLARRLAAV